MYQARQNHTWVRTIAVAIVALAAVGATGLSAGVATGQEVTEEFILGSGRSEARLVRVGPSAGQLSLAPVIGVTLTDYLNNVGRAESRIADFAALEVSLPPEVVASVPPLKVASTDEGAAEGKTVATAGTPAGSPASIGALRQSARADATPDAEASFELGDLDVVPGVVEVAGGRATSRARIIDGATREASGVSTIGSISLGGGAVVLEGLRWEAVQRTGAAPDEVGRFSIEGLTVAGAPIPVPEDPVGMADTFAQLNEVLAPTGLRILPPEVTNAAGVVRISPLTIQAGDSEVGNTVLGPVVGGLQPVREPLADALISADPTFATAFLLADITLGVFSGGSKLDIQLGGANAFTEGVAFDNPFGSFDLGGGFDLGGAGAGAPSLGGGTPASAGSLSGTRSPGTPGTPGTPATPGTPGTADPSGTTAGPAAGGGSVAAELAGSTVPGSRGGPAALVGLVGLLAALAMAGADWQRLRGGARVIPVEA